MMFSSKMILVLSTLLFIIISSNVTCFSFGSNTRHFHLQIRGHATNTDAASSYLEPNETTSTNIDAIGELIRQCAIQRTVDATTIIPALEQLEIAKKARNSVDDTEMLDGTFELVFSSAVANLPVVGKIFGGYMPNKELITFDIARKQMSLIVEILPFLPTIDIYGDSLEFDKELECLEYTIRGKEDKPSRWEILYADSDVVAAKSSVTGLNIIRRIK